MSSASAETGAMLQEPDLSAYAERVAVTINAKTVDVAFGDTITEAAIVAAIEDQGYEVEASGLGNH